MIRDLVALLRRLFGPSCEAGAAARPPPAPAAHSLLADCEGGSPEAVAARAPAPTWDLSEPEPEDEDAWGEEDEDVDGPDPYILGDSAAAVEPVEPLAVQREMAKALALSGTHRLALSTPAGPGSLAEALNRLVQEGLVDATFVEAEADGPHMVYRPRGAESQ